MVNMTGLQAPGMALEISLIDYAGNSIYSNVATPHKNSHYLYYVGPFIPPKSGLFFIRVKGVDEFVGFFHRDALGL